MVHVKCDRDCICNRLPGNIGYCSGLTRNDDPCHFQKPVKQYKEEIKSLENSIKYPSKEKKKVLKTIHTSHGLMYYY